MAIILAFCNGAVLAADVIAQHRALMHDDGIAAKKLFDMAKGSAPFLKKHWRPVPRKRSCCFQTTARLAAELPLCRRYGKTKQISMRGSRNSARMSPRRSHKRKMKRVSRRLIRKFLKTAAAATNATRQLSSAGNPDKAAMLHLCFTGGGERHVGLGNFGSRDSIRTCGMTGQRGLSSAALSASGIAALGRFTLASEIRHP
jgi:hypothetical protein